MAITTTLLSQYSQMSAVMQAVKRIIEPYGFFDAISISATTNTMTFVVDGVTFMTLTFTDYLSDSTYIRTYISKVSFNSKNGISIAGLLSGTNATISGNITTIS